MRPARDSMILAALLAVASSGVAQTPPGEAPAVPTPPSIAAPADGSARVRTLRRELAVACRTDIRAWCGKVEPGGGRILQCFRQNADKLTPACVATLKALRGAGPAAPSQG